MLRTRNRRRSLFDQLESRLALTGFYVSPLGDDAAAGTIDDPWRTIPHAVATVAPGDVINLRAGVYGGGIYVDKPDLTIQSYAGERATLTATAGSNNLYFGATGGKALNLDLSGGFYGVKFDEDGGLIDGCKITGTAYYGIKVIPGADHVTISRTEIGYTGSGGIDDVNGDYLTIRDCYIHDTGSDGMHIKGGAIGVVIERNRVEDSRGTGITIGQLTATEFFDPSQNPAYYEIIRPIVRNNVVAGTDYAGVAIYAAQQPEVYNNTLIDTALIGQASLYLTSQTHDLGDGNPPRTTVTTDPSIVNNIVTRTVAGIRPLVHITDRGFTGTLTMDHNRYYNAGAKTAFWDERSGSTYSGTFAAWPAHVGAESGSTEGDPRLDGTGRLVAGSPCIDAGRTLAAVTDDIDRVARAGTYDIGADEFTGVITVERPPVAIDDTATTAGIRPIRITMLADDDSDDDPLAVMATTSVGDTDPGGFARNGAMGV